MNLFRYVETAGEAWRVTFDDGFKNGQTAPGPRCTPLVDGDRIYVQSCRGELQCLGTSDGQLRWRVNFLRDFQSGVLLPAIAARMRETGFSFHEYLVGTPGTLLRRSTTAINDGRQSFGILGTLSFIQEGRKWRTDTDSLRRRSLAQLAGIRSFLAECGLRAAHIRSLVAASRRPLSRPGPRSAAHGRRGAPQQLLCDAHRRGRVAGVAVGTDLVGVLLGQELLKRLD